MRDILILAVHLLVTLAKLLRPGGVRAVAAESLLLTIVEGQTKAILALRKVTACF